MKSTAGRLAKNTLIIYLQRFSSAALSFITTPIILRVLGVEDYGLYTVVIGFVGMISFLNWSLSASTQRFIAVELGRGQMEKLSRIFSTAFFIHLFYAVVLLVIMALISIFFVNDILNITVQQQKSAGLILAIVAVITFLNIITIPFIGVLRAHENFTVIAILGIVESSLKLIAAFLLPFLIGEKVLIYAILLFVVTLIVFLLNAGYSFRKYKEVSVQFKLFEVSLCKEMLAFISWSFLGAIAIMSRNQGVSVLINIFFGVAKNAAYGISMQVNAAINILAQGITAAINPLILKSAGKGDIKLMVYLMRTMSKLSTFAISLISIPLFFEAPVLLNLWLKNVPDDTVVFTRCVVILIQVILLSSGIQIVFDAIGKVKEYNSWVSVILILNLPISYILFKIGFPAYSIIGVAILLELICLVVKIQLLKRYVDFSVKEFYTDTIARILTPIFIVCSLLYIVSLGGQWIGEFTKLFISFGISLLVYPLIVYRFSLDNYQKGVLQVFLGKISQKLPGKKSL